MNAISPDATNLLHAMTLGGDNLRSSGEMAMAAGQVIAHRMGLGVSAMVAPGDADHAEFARMVPEKLEAFTHSGTALLRRSGKTGEALLRYSAAEMAAASQALLALSTARSPTALALAPMQYAQGWFDRALRQCMSLGLHALHAQSAALAPIHRAATQNAARLSKANG
jgi:sensor domain CHASE-containing protein